MATNGVNGNHLPALHTSPEEFLKQEYDFVIVGGGTAGLVVAARLSENEDINVGVLEAGTSKLGDMLVDSPVMFMQTFNNPDYDWGFKTEPQVCDSYESKLTPEIDDIAETQQESSSPHPKR